MFVVDKKRFEHLERLLQKEGLEKDCWNLSQNFTLLKEGEGSDKKTQKEGGGKKFDTALIKEGRVKDG